MTVPTRALFLASGNNVGPVGDMTRRYVSITLDPRCELPAARTFQLDPVGRVRAARGRYVSAVLTIVLAWLAADRPQTDCRALASYGAWSMLCRQPLLWLGVGDPAASVWQQQQDDPEREVLSRLLTAWQAAFGRVATPVRVAVAHTEGGRAGPVRASCARCWKTSPAAATASTGARSGAGSAAGPGASSMAAASSAIIPAAAPKPGVWCRFARFDRFALAGRRKVSVLAL